MKKRVLALIVGMGLIGAMARIYNGDQLVHTFAVPDNAAGNLWKARGIVNGVVEW